MTLLRKNCAYSWNYKYLCWLYTEKMRAGWVHANEPPENIQLWLDMKLNTVIVGAGYYNPGTWVENPNSTWNQTLLKWRNWAKAAKQAKLHCFIAFDWMLLGSTEMIYRKARTIDGTELQAVCPLDAIYWNNHIWRVSKAIAEMSLESDVRIDGIFLDNEWYGAEGLPQEQRDYATHTCFCEYCRKMQNYQKEDEIAILSAKCLNSIRKINPRLIMGMYPTLTYGNSRNWVRETIAQEWGTPDFPMILFATDTYYGKEKPVDPVSDYSVNGVYCVYAPGYTLRSYSHTHLANQLKRNLKQNYGYWLFRMEQLFDPQKYEALGDGTREDYIQVIKRANG